MLIYKRVKPLQIVVVTVCFGLGIILTRLIITLLIDTPNEIPDPKPTDIAFSQNLIVASPHISMLSIALPAPPTAPILSPNQVKSKVNSFAKPDLTQKTADQTKKQVLSTLDDDVIKHGLNLLNNTPLKHAPDIQIALPNKERERERIMNMLRQCMGVKLGKISINGNIIAQETNLTNISSYLRLVDGDLTSQEAMIAKKWLQLSGTFVRFYPEKLDAKIFGGLALVINQGIENKIIKGEYSLSDNVLKLVNIEINHKKQATDLILEKNCSSS